MAEKNQTANGILGRRISWPGLISLFVGFAMLALFIPFFMPVTPTLSDSYLFGYSNKAFTEILVAEIAIVFLSIRLGFVLLPTVKMYAANTELKTGKLLWRLPLVAAISLVVFQLAILWLVPNGFSHYEDNAYFIPRAELINLGKVPFRDFQYAYGYLLLYPIAFVAKAAHVSYSLSLVATYTAETLIGYACLYYITVAMFGREIARYPFLCVAIPSVFTVFQIAPHTTFFRFAAPLAIAIWLFRFTASHARHIWLSSAGTVVTFIIANGISPELSITVTLSMMVATLLRLREDHRRCAAFLLATILIFAALFVMWPWFAKSFAGVISFSQGGDNIPVFPSLFTIVTLFFVALSTLFISTQSAANNEVAFLIATYSILNLPGGFGRGDIEHANKYLFGFFLVGLKYLQLTKGTGRSFKLAGALYACVYTLFVLVLVVKFYAIDFYATVRDEGMPLLSENQKRYIISLAPASKRDVVIKRLYQRRIEQPLDQYSGAISLVLDPTLQAKNAATFKYSFYAGGSATFPAAYKTIVQEIGNNRYVITPYHYYENCRKWDFSNEILTYIFLFPVSIFPHRNDPGALRYTLCDKLSHFTDLQLPTHDFSVLEQN